MSILSKIQDKIDGQGIPGVRGFQQFCTPLLLLSPQEEGLHSSARVRLFPDR